MKKRLLLIQRRYTTSYYYVRLGFRVNRDEAAGMRQASKLLQLFANTAVFLINPPNI
jgi:hypothetical protein